MKRDLKSLLTLAAVASTLIVGAAPAQASRGGGDPAPPRIVVVGGGPLVDLDDVIPGSSGSSDFTVANNSDDDAVLSFRIVDLSEDDNGCQPAETAAGDVTCGDGGGELGRDLRLSVVPLGAGGAPSGPAAFDETVRALTAWTLIGDLPEETEQAFRLDWELPAGSPNDTQTDSMDFNIEFVLTEAAGSGDDTDGVTAGDGGGTGLPTGDDSPAGGDTETQTGGDTGTGGDDSALVPGGSDVDTDVLGAQLEPTGTPVKVPGTELPRTGSDPFPAVELGALAVLAGVLLLALTRRPGGASR